MEETRISRMYLTLFLRWLSELPGRILSGQWLRSGVTWIVLGIVLLIGIAVAVHEKGRGDLHRLKTDLGASTPAPAQAAAPQPGGQAPIVLNRGQAAGAFTPEFLSVTLLPGRGLNVFQITAYVPGKGAIPLLASPSLEEAARDDSDAQASLTGAPLELPWSGRIGGTPLPGDISLSANWLGRTLTLPVEAADGGLLLKAAALSSDASVLPDGGLAQATFDAQDFDGHWPSKTQVKTTVVLTGHNIDITIVARNTGTEPEPMGIGWKPRFALAAADRAQFLLRLPSSTRVAIPTGHSVAVEGTPFDFSSANGTPLRSTVLDDLYVNLKTGSLSSGPETELRNPAAGYGLRLTALSPSIKAIHITAPAGQTFLSIDPQTNYDDPLGRQWPQGFPGALTILKPGETLEWKVRLEIFALTPASPNGTSPFLPLRQQP